MVQRWLYSTNAKDIAVLYFMIALFSGMAGTAMSMIIRLELAAPGSQYLAGNNQLFNVLVVGHAVLMIFFLVMPALIGGFGKINLYNNYYIKYNYNNNNKLYNYNNSINYNKLYIINIKRYISLYNNNKLYIINIKRDISLYNKDKLGPYLSGLIEGNGTIWVPEYNNKLKPLINIIFHIINKPLADYLCSILNIGKVYDRSNKGKYCIWQLLKIEDLYIFINLINGYLRTPKYETLIKLINWINIYIDNNKLNNNNINYIKYKSIDNSLLINNGWLSGFSDINSNFIIIIINKKRTNNIIKLNYNLEIKQLYKNNNNNFNYYNLIINIANLFNNNLLIKIKNIKLKNNNYKLYYLYNISINNNINNLLLVNNYYIKYPLLSIKYLNYINWSNLLLNIHNNNNSFLNINSINLYNKLIINNNNINRIINNYNWKHLNNNYYIK